MSYVKTPPPRPLVQTETLDSLDHWKTTFRNYFRRDSIYKQFLVKDCKWDPKKVNYGLAEIGSVSAADRKESLIDFLNQLAGFLPHSYLTSKLEEESTSLEKCWDIIYEHYNVQVTPETLLDFESLKKEPAENYRQFFERLLQHSKLHLAPEDAKVGTKKNEEKDVMTISLMNHVAVQWLRKIDSQLIQIVKTEYSTELRSGEQLAALVPKIAPNIESLLARYSSANVNKVSTDASEHDDGEKDDPTYVRFAGSGFRQRGGRGGSFRGGRNRTTQGNNPQLFCAGCFSMGKQLNTFISFKHRPADCTRQRAVSRILQAADEDFPEENDEDGDDFDDGKGYYDREESTNVLKLQNKCPSEGNLGVPAAAPGKSSQNLVTPSNVVLTININQVSGEIQKSSHDFSMKDGVIQNKIESPVSDAEIVRKVQKIEERKHLWSSISVRKERSPMVTAFLDAIVCTPTIDEGSEINCVDKAFAEKANITLTPTNCTAMAAGSNSMIVIGQTKGNVTLKIPHNSSSISWDLGKCVVVDNLGVNILIGEPAKIDNKIITKSHLKIIETRDSNGKTVEIPYFDKKDEHRFLCRSPKSQVVLQGESLTFLLPPRLHNETHLAVSPIKENSHNFVKPEIVEVQADRTIKIQNVSRTPVFVKKNYCFADITTIKDYECGKVCVKPGNLSHLERPKIFTESEAGKSYTSQVVIDPDNQLSQIWKTKFKNVCEEFIDVINPNPGRYNTFYGDVDCSIDFCSTPPPSVKARLPNYSLDKLKIMAELMDKMETMGVLAKPEDAGVVPTFVVPSLLVPKPDGDWRVVSDFTPLNIHIRKFETVSPGIEEAKRTLAKFKYNIEMDLSNYFWQGGMKKEDLQYLATPHPFKGLRVYTVEPQGLRNASEHSYEKLTRIFGDLRQTDKMTCMADGLYVLGDTLEELMENFVEILDRARNAGLTFKPKKMVIAPKDTVLFGWRKVGDGWQPVEHTVSPLTKAEEPVTVKQLRSFIGSYKQLSECIEGYAVLLGPLEKAVAGKDSADRIEWTSELSKNFTVAKEALTKVDTIFVPKPSDKLDIYTDYSEDKKAIGGKLVITRQENNGSVRKLLGGHFSCKLNVHQKSWLPCEGEALGVKLISKHFSPVIRESKSTSTIHTDNLPTVHAWRRMKTGAFSNSARVASFLTGLSALTVEVVHKPGKDMVVSDYNSRHPNSCNENRCKICKFAYEMEKIGDNVVYVIRSVAADDVEKGLVRMPHSQRQAWKRVQSDDRVHKMLLDLIGNSKLPEKKKTKGDFTRVKRLHNLYRTGQLKIAPDGLITVKHTDSAGNVYDAISVPVSFFPGLVHALHIKLSHPSRAQMQKLVSRFFYCAGHSRIIEEIFASCTICAALKEIPKELFSQSTVENSVFGSNFSADVIKKDGQLIFLCREKLSQLTSTRFIPDETADSLRDSIVMAVLELMPDSGATVQVDCAPGLQTLAAESKLDGSVLKKLGIYVDLGRTLNKNKNPVAENAIKEFHKERLKLNPAGGRVTEIERSIITRNINSRVRERGLTSKEMAFNRDQISNEVKPSDDKFLSQKQLASRIDKHPKTKIKTSTKFSVGDNVFLKFDKSKLRGREMYKITKLFQKNQEPCAILQKCESKFMSKEYEVKIAEIFPIVKNSNTNDNEENSNEANDKKDTSENVKDFDDKPTEEDTVVNATADNENNNGNDEDINRSENDVDKTATKEEINIQETHNNMARPPRRRAALKSRENFKKIIDCLHVKTISKPQFKNTHPIHGWNYDDWVKSIEESDDEETNVNIDFPIHQFQSWCASQPKYPTPEPLFLSWFKTKYPAMDTVALKAIAEGLAGEVMENRSISSENTTSDNSVMLEPTTPFTELLNALDDNTAALNVVTIDDAQSSMGLLQMFPTHDEDGYVWDHNTSQIELATQNTPRKIEPGSDLLETALQPRTLFVANNDYNIDDESLTSDESDADDVFDDPSILEVSINGTKRFSRSSESRGQAKKKHVPPIDADDDHDHGYTAEAEEEPEEMVGDDRPRRRGKRIDYALLHRFGRQ